jgi:hypothetical protein
VLMERKTLVCWQNPKGFGEGDSQGFPTLTLRAGGWKRRSLGIVIFRNRSRELAQSDPGYWTSAFGAPAASHLMILRSRTKIE